MLIEDPRFRSARGSKFDSLPAKLITTTEDLAAACERMASHAFVTVDTEFLRESTYYPLLCVAQMASPTEAIVIDALAAGIDLSPFYALMANERVIKVFHAARQDVEIIWNLASLIPRPLFDTQVAAMVLGYGDAISYDQLVHRITGDALDKSSRFTDWARRPLTSAQISYAISDVTHLRDVYLALTAGLAERGRANWVNEEMEILTSPDTYRADPETAWERLKSRVRKPKELAILIELAAWREREAQLRDVPRGRVLKDDVLGDIATQAPRDWRRCARCRRVLSARNGDKIFLTRFGADLHTMSKRYRALSGRARRLIQARRWSC
jgi:ribonuclease D